jgi:hypothetical protein
MATSATLEYSHVLIRISCYASKLHDPGSEALAARESAWKFR